MPIAVTCPGCSAKMKAPDAAAGKKVKCPKCQGVITVPGSAQFEVVDEQSAPAKRPGFGGGPKPTMKAAPEVVEEEEKPNPKVKDEDEEDEKPRKNSKAAVEEDEEDEKPRKKRRDEDDKRDAVDKPRKKAKAAAEDDEDDKPRKKTRDEDDEDDRPTKKKKKKRSDDEGGATNMVRNVIGVVLLVILLGVAGYVFYDKYGKTRDEETASNPTPPSGPPGGSGSGRPSGPPGGRPGGSDMGQPGGTNAAAVPLLHPRTKFKPSSDCHSIKLSDDGKILAVGWHTPEAKDVVTVWDISGEPKSLAQFECSKFELSPSGKFLVTYGVPKVFEVSTKKLVAELKSIFMSHMYFRDDNTLVWTTRSFNFPEATKGKIFVWDVAKNADAGSFDIPDNRFETALPANDGKEIWLVMSNKKFVIECYDLAGKKLLRTIKPEDDSGRPFTSSGSWFSLASDSSVFATHHSKLQIFDAKTGKIIGGLPADVGATVTGLLASGSRYLACGSRKLSGLSENDFVICDWVMKKNLAAIVCEEKDRMIGVSGDGKTLVSLSKAGEAQVFDISTVK
jgi:WD40 repeat protein